VVLDLAAPAVRLASAQVQGNLLILTLEGE
jgi:hypothetical protein